MVEFVPFGKILLKKDQNFITDFLQDNGTWKSKKNCFLADGCPRESFLCSNHHCLNASVLCDGKNDCGDNSDEGTICSGTILIISL